MTKSLSNGAVLLEVEGRQIGLLVEQRRGYIFYTAIKALARLDRQRFATPKAAARAIREQLCQRDARVSIHGRDTQ